MKIALNILIATPMNKVNANPTTRLAPSLEPNQNRIAQVMKVETLLSRMEGQARLNPVSVAFSRLLPLRNSSFIRSKMRMFASTAIPILYIHPKAETFGWEGVIAHRKPHYPEEFFNETFK